MSRLASKVRQLLGLKSRLHRKKSLQQKYRLELEALESRVVPAGNASSTVLGVSFLDGNGNGAFDAQESVLSGAQTTLTGTTNLGETVNATAVSDANGVFQFLNVLPGVYQLQRDERFYLFEGSTGTFDVTGGETITRNTGYLGLSAEFISLRQFLNTTGGDQFFDAPGDGEGLANFRENNIPILAMAPGDLIVGKNTSEVFDLAGFFSDPDFTNSRIRFDTSLGDINVELFDTDTPRTVANFFNYITSDRYDGSVFHRLDPGFVLQGGGFTFTSEPSSLDAISKDPAVQNEFGQSNIFGTIAMAKLPGDPNSATNEFFFNLGDNSTNLDDQNGGFTVFGEITGPGDEAVLNAISAVPTRNFGSPFDEIPLVNFTGQFPEDTTADNFVLVNNVEVVQRDEFLSYTLLSNSNPGVISATIDQNRLFIDTVAGAAGTAQVTVRATDRFGATLDHTFTVVVENQAPVVAVELDDDRPLEGDTLTAGISAEDPNGDAFTVTYVWKVNGVEVQNSGPTTDVMDTFDLSGVASPGDTVTVEVTGTDNAGLVGETAIAEAIVNQPPTTTGIDDTTFSGPGEFTLDISDNFTDPEGDSISFSVVDDIVPLPDWLNFSSDGVFSGNPSQADEAVLSIEVVATDALGSSTSTTFELTITNTPDSLNDIPQVSIHSFSPNPPGENDTLTVTATPSDGDDEPVLLTYVWKINDLVVQTTAATASETDTLDLTGIAASGDTVVVEVTPNDGTTDGETQLSTTVTVS